MRRILTGILITYWTVTTAVGQNIQGEDPFVPLAMAISDDGSLLATCQLTNRGRPGGETTITEARSGKYIFKVSWNERTPVAVGFSPDGRLLAIGGGDNMRDGNAGIVEVVETTSGKRTLYHEDRDGIVRHLAFSHDGQRLAVKHWEERKSRKMSAKVMDAVTGRVERTFTSQELGLDNLSHNPLEWQPAIHPDGRFLSLTGWDDRVFEAVTLKTVYSATRGEGWRVRRLHFADNGRVSIVIELRRRTPGNFDESVSVLDAKTGTSLGRIDNHRNGILCAAVSPGAKRIITGGYDKSAKVWDVATGKLISEMGHIQRVLAVAFVDGGQHALSIGADGKPRLWNAETGKAVLPD